MMSDKFSLKWNDFERNISRSFGLLRSEEEFFDVTLVSDDQQTMSAHKVVLSASSPYFKNVLTRNKHSHPLLCLQGVDSTLLKTVLDYIYTGQVEVLHEDLGKFLSIAEKFQLEALTTKSSFVDLEEDDTDHDKERKRFVKQDVTKEEEDVGDMVDDIVDDKEERKEKEEEDMEELSEELQSSNLEKAVENSLSPSLKVESFSKEEVEQKIVENIERLESGGYSCRVCGKTSSGKSARTILRQHVETHLEGLSYPCQHCEKTLRYK